MAVRARSKAPGTIDTQVMARYFIGMKVWLLIIYTSGAMPPAGITVEKIASREQCQALGEAVVADHKHWNSANRYFYSCYEYTQAP